MPVTAQNQLDRREAIRHLLARGPVSNQRWLVEALTAQGLEATQSSVSRDLRELGAIKTAAGYELPERSPGDDPAITGAGELILSTQAAGTHLLVVRTAVGAAQRVALALDESGWPEIVGTVAGDDTIFIATGGASRQRNLRSRLAALTAHA